MFGLSETELSGDVGKIHLFSGLGDEEEMENFSGRIVEGLREEEEEDGGNIQLLVFR